MYKGSIWVPAIARGTHALDRKIYIIQGSSGAADITVAQKGRV